MQPETKGASLEAKYVSTGLKARSTGDGVDPKATEANLVPGSTGMIMEPELKEYG